MNFLYITLFIIIIFLLFLLYRFLVGDKRPLVSNIYLKNGVPDIPLSLTDYGTYTIELWIYVNTLPGGNPYLGGPDCATSNSNFGSNDNMDGFIINTTSGNLSLDLYSNGKLTFYNGRVGNGNYPSVMTENFPVQKWTYVIISVRKTFVDLYINGKLIQSANYNGSSNPNKFEKPTSSDNLRFGKTLDAFISKMYIHTKPMDTKTAWNQYLKGNGIKMNYNIGVSLTQNGTNTNNVNFL